MQNFGFYFGVPMGIILVFIVRAYPTGGCCRSAASSSATSSTTSASP